MSLKSMAIPPTQQGKLGKLPQLTRRVGVGKAWSSRGPIRLRAATPPAGLGSSLLIFSISVMALLYPLTSSLPTSPLISSFHLVSCPNDTQPPPSLA